MILAHEAPVLRIGQFRAMLESNIPRLCNILHL